MGQGRHKKEKKDNAQKKDKRENVGKEKNRKYEISIMGGNTKSGKISSKI